MCSRFTLNINSFDLRSQYGVAVNEEFDALNNIAPTDRVPVVVNKAQTLRASLLKWGYNTGWSNGPKLIINLKSETVLEKKFAQKSAAQSRCILPASGFIEWVTKADKSKQPVFFEKDDSKLFGLAGLVFTNPNKEQECVVLTASANKLVSKVHDRMPVMISPEDWSNWLQVGDTAAIFSKFTHSFPESRMQAWQVDPVINNSRNKSPINKAEKFSNI